MSRVWIDGGPPGSLSFEVEYDAATGRYNRVGDAKADYSGVRLPDGREAVPGCGCPQCEGIRVEDRNATRIRGSSPSFITYDEASLIKPVSFQVNVSKEVWDDQINWTLANPTISTPKEKSMFSIKTVKVKAGVIGQVFYGSRIVWESQPVADVETRYDEDGDVIESADTIARQRAQARIDEAVDEMFVDVRPVAE